MTRLDSKSDSQANADALYRREAPYTAASGASFDVWDYRQRQPRDLRDAVRILRRAYADEVPTKLHDGANAIGIDGTPRMSSRAEGYIFGNPDGASDPDDPTGWYHAPFRARLAEWEHATRRGSKQSAAIVRHIALGGMLPWDAAVLEGVPDWCAHIVARAVVARFLAELSDLKVRRLPVYGEETAA